MELVATFAAGILETNGKGREVVDADLPQQANQQARVDPAREQHAHIHRRALTDGHGLAGAVEDAVAPVFQGQPGFIGVGAVGQLPPDLLLAIALGIDTQPAGRRQFLDTGQQRARCRYHGVEVQVVVECDRVQHGADVAALEQRWQAGGKAQALSGVGQVQRLDPEAVAGQEQLLAVALPDGQGKHAVEPGQQVGAPGVVALEQHLGVAVAVKPVAEAFQLAAQFREVVDGAVEGQ
ncbi:hypothetical protein D3C84_317270 [compost metagenome]